MPSAFRMSTSTRILFEFCDNIVLADLCFSDSFDRKTRTDDNTPRFLIPPVQCPTIQSNVSELGRKRIAQEEYNGWKMVLVDSHLERNAIGKAYFKYELVQDTAERHDHS